MQLVIKTADLNFNTWKNYDTRNIDLVTLSLSLCAALSLFLSPTEKSAAANKIRLGFSRAARASARADINGADAKWENSVQWNFRAGCLPLTSIQSPSFSVPPFTVIACYSPFFLVCCFRYFCPLRAECVISFSARRAKSICDILSIHTCRAFRVCFQQRYNKTQVVCRHRFVER